MIYRCQYFAVLGLHFAATENALPCPFLLYYQLDAAWNSHNATFFLVKGKSYMLL
jgi:hypothetical protein